MEYTTPYSESFKNQGISTYKFNILPSALTQRGYPQVIDIDSSQNIATALREQSGSVQC